MHAFSAIISLQAYLKILLILLPIRSHQQIQWHILT